jgi:hypothetical protein
LLDLFSSLICVWSNRLFNKHESILVSFRTNERRQKSFKVLFKVIYLAETEKNGKFSIRIRFDSTRAIFDSILFDLLFKNLKSIRFDSTESTFGFDSIRQEIFSIRFDSIRFTLRSKKDALYFDILSFFHDIVSWEWKLSINFLIIYLLFMRNDEDDDSSFKFDIIIRSVTLYLPSEIKIKKRFLYLYCIKIK